MKNYKHLLMDFYLALLAIPHSDSFRALNQSLYGQVRDSLAVQLDCDSETVQNIFERMVSEDFKKEVHSIYCINCNTQEVRVGKLCYQCVGR